MSVLTDIKELWIIAGEADITDVTHHQAGLDLYGLPCRDLITQARPAPSLIVTRAQTGDPGPGSQSASHHLPDINISIRRGLITDTIYCAGLGCDNVMLYA